MYTHIFIVNIPNPEEERQASGCVDSKKIRLSEGFLKSDGVL